MRAARIALALFFLVIQAACGGSASSPPSPPPPPAPSNLTYSTNPAVYTKGQAIANNTPSSTGGAV